MSQKAYKAKHIGVCETGTDECAYFTTIFAAIKHIEEMFERDADAQLNVYLSRQLKDGSELIWELNQEDVLEFNQRASERDEIMCQESVALGKELVNVIKLHIGMRFNWVPMGGYGGDDIHYVEACDMPLTQSSDEAWAAFIDEQGMNRSMDADEERTLKERITLAHEGDDEAQNVLGNMYRLGDVVAEDIKEAIRLYRLSAAQGNPRAQYNLGTIFEYGEGVPQDIDEAKKWYRLAAEQGDVRAQIKMGTIYYK